MSIVENISIKEAVELAVKEDRTVEIGCTLSNEDIREAVRAVPGDYRIFRIGDTGNVFIDP